MRVRFGDDKLDRLEADPKFDAGFQQAVIVAFRRRMQMIRSAVDERDLRKITSHHFEKLRGDRTGQYSMRLNDQWRLILTIEGEGDQKTIVVLKIEDYH